MKASVVIPTYKRPDILKRCLSALGSQRADKSLFEVIIVEDGEESLRETVEEAKKEYKLFNIRYFFQKKQGQGQARNRGVKEAVGEIIIFIGDDIFPDENFIAEHLRMHVLHDEDNEAVLGLTLWHPDLSITPLMDFMTKGGALFGKFGGHQFAYDLLEGKTEAGFRFFYTSNISLKRNLILNNPFDPLFAGYGWEDIELGYRLYKKTGLRLFYNKNAIGYHYHPMEDSDFRLRMRNIGRSLRGFHEKYPELGFLPRGAKKSVMKCLASAPSVSLLKSVRGFSPSMFKNLYYFALSKKYLLEGIEESATKK